MTSAQPADAGAPSRVWLLYVMICTAGWMVLDDLWDAGVLKLAFLSLLCAVLVVPVLAFAGRDALGSWFGASAARLLVLSTALASLGALAVLDHASVTDRLLLFGLANVSAVCGLLAAERRPEGLAGALMLCGVVVAAVCWAQALGYEQSLTTGADEVVGLSGNSIRAGGLLALVVVATLVSLIARSGGASNPLWHGVVLMLCSGALVLTRARGARWALGLSLVVMAVVSWRRHEGLPGKRLGSAAALVVIGVALATWVGGADALAGRKLDDQASIFSGHDPTTEVRLALWQTAWDMTGDHPLQGVGLGRFRQYAPPYRDPVEAALPGLEGAVTEAAHPHNELLLTLAEGGWPAGLLLIVALLATLVRGLRAALREQGVGQRVALAVLVAGLALALVQDAWTDPATAVPFFAAFGFLWARRPDETRAWSKVHPAVGIGAVLLGLGLGLAAWPRLDAQMSLRTFYQRTQAEGAITSLAYSALMHAGIAGAGDPAIQRIVIDMSPIFLTRVREPADRAQVALNIETAKQRLAALELPRD
jgi:O-antigen ligase